MVLHNTNADEEVESQIAIEILSQEEEVHPCWEVLEEQKLTMLHQDPAGEKFPIEEIVAMMNLEAAWMDAGKEEEADQRVSEVDLLHLMGIVVIAEAAEMEAVATTKGLEPTTTLVDRQEQTTATIAVVDEGDVKPLLPCFWGQGNCTAVHTVPQSYRQW